MPQTITYTLGNALYVNMTNRCTCDCDFCERNTIDAVGDADSLWLEYEPSQEDVLESITTRDLSEFDELVFCGFGEPTIRLEELLWVARHVKDVAPLLPIRINTIGHANLLAGQDITPSLAGVIDVLSVSLNRADKEAYVKQMRPAFGDKAYDGMLEFVKKARQYVPNIVLTVVDLIPPDEIERCREIAEGLGVSFRVRAAH